MYKVSNTLQLLIYCLLEYDIQRVTNYLQKCIGKRSKVVINETKCTENGKNITDFTDMGIFMDDRQFHRCVMAVKS